MTKSEFKKIEAEKGFDWTMVELQAELENKKVYVIYPKWCIINEVYKQFLNENELEKGIEILTKLVDNPNCDYVFRGWITESAYDITPIKSIKDIEEFLEED